MKSYRIKFSFCTVQRMFRVWTSDRPKMEQGIVYTMDARTRPKIRTGFDKYVSPDFSTLFLMSIFLLWELHISDINIWQILISIFLEFSQISNYIFYFWGFWTFQKIGPLTVRNSAELSPNGRRFKIGDFETSTVERIGK